MTQKQMDDYVFSRLMSGRKSFKSLVMPLPDGTEGAFIECLARLKKAGVIRHAMAGGGKAAGYELGARP